MAPGRPGSVKTLISRTRRAFWRGDLAYPFDDCLKENAMRVKKSTASPLVQKPAAPATTKAKRHATLRRQAQSSREAITRHAVAQALAQERQRVAQDLHDDVGGALAVLAQGPCSEASPELARQALARLRDLLSAYQSTEVSFDDWACDLRGMLAAQCDCADVILSFAAESTQTRMIDARCAMQLSRIVREAASNALKHSGCLQLSVSLHQSHQSLQFSVHDDGCGFDPASIHPTRGHQLGLAGMRQRAHRLGLRLGINSVQGCGSTITGTLTGR
jgi:signal transduction histidine kinase